MGRSGALRARAFAASRRWAWRLAPQAQEKKIKIGVVYDLTGPFAGGGSELQYIGAKIMMDYFIKQGGVEGYKIEPIYADAQSKPDVAINEAVRLIEQEKVDMVLGFYSSAQCVPVAAQVEQLKKFMWITTCISTRRAREPPSALRLPRRRSAAISYGERRPTSSPSTPRRSSARIPRTCAWRSSTRTAPTASTSPRATRPAPRSRLQHRAEGRLLDHRARPVGAGDQAEARPAGRDLPHRLQSRHHAAAAPGARAGAEVRRDRRPGRGLQRLRQAEGGLGQRLPTTSSPSIRSRSG